MHSLSQKTIFTVLSALALLFASCTNKSAEAENINKPENQESPAIPITSAWYYFTQDETLEVPALKKINSPDEAPRTDFLPWTEAIRVSGLGLMYDPPLFLVNKAGILPAFTIDEEPKIEVKSEFYAKTADGFYKTDVGSLIRLYTNTIFSPVIQDESPSRLLRYNSVNGELLSLITPKTFNLENTSQLSALEFNKKWFTAFKTEKNDHVSFDYFSFFSFEELLKGNYFKISQEEFINASSPIVSDEDGIDKILQQTQKNVKAEFFSEDLNTKQVIFYQNSKNSYKGDFEITASVCEFKAEDKIKALLLETGELFYFEPQTQEWEELKLPKLPENFIYTYFIIKNGAIISAWEEQNFFETGRSGLLVYKIR
ncbi:hypothetical protein [Treponema putidum]|uniref:hypothetical protein n=1 Tax=Treponema putidum TaxID=221027 RepID=UPI000A749EAA|nr:hypothetical protein [Treponema putidum]TWI76973.1 hypothetical protein JM98_01537 [Treponema putidum]